jgi:hypothetical protein
MRHRDDREFREKSASETDTGGRRKRRAAGRDRDFETPAVQRGCRNVLPELAIEREKAVIRR